jgi:hypothetical protein
MDFSHTITTFAQTMTWLHLMTAVAVLAWLIILRGLSHLLPWSFPLLLPGVWLHEGLHYAIGKLVYAKPCGFSFSPVKTGNAWVLGRVHFANLRGYNTIPATMAPLLLLPVGLWLLGFAIDAPTWLQWGWWVLIAGYSLWASIPSHQDIWLATRSIFSISGLLIMSAIAGWIYLK